MLTNTGGGGAAAAAPAGGAAAGGAAAAEAAPEEAKEEGTLRHSQTPPTATRYRIADTQVQRRRSRTRIWASVSSTKRDNHRIRDDFVSLLPFCTSNCMALGGVSVSRHKTIGFDHAKGGEERGTACVPCGREQSSFSRFHMVNMTEKCSQQMEFIRGGGKNFSQSNDFGQNTSCFRE